MVKAMTSSSIKLLVVCSCWQEKEHIGKFPAITSYSSNQANCVTFTTLPKHRLLSLVFNNTHTHASLDMVTLESVSEPRIEPISRPETPQETQSAPASFKSVRLLSIYLDAGHPRAPRRSSEGDHPESVSQVPTIPLIMDSEVSTSSNAKPLSSAASFHATVGDDETAAPGPRKNMPGSIVDSDPDSAKELYRYTSFPPGTSTDDLFRDSEKGSSVTAEALKTNSNETTGQYLALPLQSAGNITSQQNTCAKSNRHQIR